MAADHDKMDREIVGPAVLFSTESSADYDRFTHETTPSVQLTEHVLGLNCAELLDLTFWVDSIGPEASPFSE